ncbi:MAG: protein kinase domain-containing protein [Terriglobales bacterium]
MIGSSFGNYRIEQKLGEGGMGVVYLAIDKDLERKVALKTLTTGGDQDEELVSRFLREAKAASRLQHPSIVTLYHFGVEGDTRYMVMEYIEGQTLRKAIAGKPLSIAKLLDYAIQIVDGIALAHDNGVIHRDLKAENIMVTDRGHVKILDFGLAKLKAKQVTSDDVTDFRTQFGMVVGTVTTMSPEQAMGREVDASSDVFSLGVIFYQMATGKLPFEGPTPQATMAMILNQEPTPVDQVNPDLPPALAQLIEHCLQKSSVFRPSSRELLTKLRNIQASLSGPKQPASQVRSAVSTAAAPAAAPAASGSVAAAPAPASSTRMKAPSSARMAASPQELSSRKTVFYAVKTVRVLLSLGTLTIPLAYLLYFFIAGGMIRPQAVEGTALMRFIQAVVMPALAAADKIFAFHAAVGGWNFLLLGLGVVAFIARYLFMLPVNMAEQWAKTRMVKARAVVPQATSVTVSEGASAPRLALLREYAEAKKVLFEDKKHLAFYSLDVMDSTNMKAGQDQLVVEHAFAEFKKYVDRILELNGCWKMSWTPDGVMCAFRDTESSIKAAQEVLRGLDWFNDGVHALTRKFRVRSGVHCGDVVFPDGRNITEVSDFVIDVTGHLQKHCAENSLWVSREAVEQLPSSAGFTPVERDVDGHTVFGWRADVKNTAAANQ